MLSKIKDLVAKMSPVVSKAVSLAPLPAGIVIGYVGHPVIKLAVSAAISVVKLVLR